MHENCNPDSCPVNARVDALEKEFDRYRDGSTTTHKEMYDRLGRLERDQTGLQTWKDNVDEKLDTIVQWVEAEKNKPNKFLDKLKGNAAWLILSAFLGALLMKLGLSI